MRVGMLVGAVLLAACSRNPATGKLQFGLPSDDEEITLGREADAEVRAAMPVYDEVPSATKLVADVGAKLAKDSERPQLPWTFTVLDEPAVNAFALPGGWVYVTRGLLVNLGSDDELAAVLGHETGHVTARHGVVQLRKQNTARRTVGVFRVIDPNLRHVGGIAASAAGVALLKYSRDDEHQADDLAVRYVKRGGWDTGALVRVFEVLTSLAQGAEKEPPWLSTHPDPAERRDRTAGMLGLTPPVAAAAEPEYLAAIEGVVVGPDPRDGFLATPSLFANPRRGYELQLPSGWKIVQQREQVIALSPDERAIFLAMPTKYDTAKAALDAFFADGGMTRGEHIQGTVGGFPFESISFALADDEGGGTLMGLVAFVSYPGKAIALIALGPEQGWSERSGVLANTFGSFGKIADPRVAAIEPLRVHVVTLEKQSSIAELVRDEPGALDAAALARLNGVAPDSLLPAGRLLKQVKQGAAPK